jgi:formylglycine-generating enzyme required for sulfatase activity
VRGRAEAVRGDGNGQWQSGTACHLDCSAGVCVDPPSCIGLAETCGPAPGSNEYCCATPVVVGGTYNRSNNAAYPATVSDFRLDRFEITVGRFRKFFASYPGNKPAAGAGAHPLIAGSGWQVGWDASLAADQAALKMAVNCDPQYQTWTDAVGGNEDKPMSCLDWYEVFAFCAWDGGRLPTEAEWNYAAAGGGEQRQYPWSSPPSSTTIDNTYAIYNGAPIPAVGAVSSKGDGKWGQADLAGGVSEWNLDWDVEPYPVSPCNDCATTSPGTPAYRVARGGSWTNVASLLLSSARYVSDPADRNSRLGARCARTP